MDHRHELEPPRSGAVARVLPRLYSTAKEHFSRQREWCDEKSTVVNKRKDDKKIQNVF